MSEKRILLVDDDPDLRLTLKLPLEAAGYEVVEANSFSQGQEVVKDVEPDLIVLDVMMDTATAGFQFALDLKSPDPNSEFKHLRETPIIMLTAIHSTTPLRFSPDQDFLPVDLFLEKPVEPEDLLEKVRELLGE
ncbi:MAG: response regulator transcription factor [Anaerolineales bacterium]|nr:response regulator transcription factor [Anaerolineales bacterium]